MQHNTTTFEIKYDTPIEVSQEKYQILMSKCAGLVAGMKKDDKYYIKVWLMSYANYVKSIILS